MNKLQQLLDEKWPLYQGMHDDYRKTSENYRFLYSQGYNEAKEEARSVVSNMESAAYAGRPGCKYGDTDYDSLSVAYGYRIALQDAQATLYTL